MKETKFKQTEVGLIPSDWEETYLGNIGPVKMCKRVMKYQTSEKGDIPFYKIGTFGKSPDAYISKDLYHYLKNKYSFPQKGTVLISAAGTIGRTVVYDGKDAFFQDSNIVWLENDESVLTNQYLYYLYQVVEWKTENGGAVSRLYNDNFKITPVAIPSSKKEQQRIANALSDVDTLIANLEKLIAKKKNIKQGAMQQLLTGGKKRLPGFAPDERTGSRPTDERRKACHSERSAKREVEESSGYKMTELGMIPTDWEVKPIKELGLFLGGGTPSTKNESFWKGNIPWISSADLNDDDIEHIAMTRFITQEAVNFSATQICPQGTILIIARVGVGKLALSQQKVCTSQDFCNLIPSKENDSKFLAYALLPVMKRMSNESQGTSIKGVAVDEIKKVQIIVPSSKDEQTAIANVLSDMDTEISALETKLAKYRTLKTGMMQQLLTGKIRLIDAKPEKASVENNRVVPVAFKRAVLAAEIAHRLCAEPTFGHVKMEKMLFLAEKMCELDINSSYHRDAAGPYDNRALRSVDSQLEKQKWFKFIRSDKGNHYIPLEKRGGHSQYFDRYYSECRSVFDNIISTFKTAKTEQCEIVATLYSAWEDFLNQGANPTDDQIVTEVLTNWNESKKRISKERWIKALLWMKENGFVPGRT